MSILNFRHNMIFGQQGPPPPMMGMPMCAPPPPMFGLGGLFGMLGGFVTGLFAGLAVRARNVFNPFVGNYNRQYNPNAGIWGVPTYDCYTGLDTLSFGQASIPPYQSSFSAGQNINFPSGNLSSTYNFGLNNFSSGSALQSCHIDQAAINNAISVSAKTNTNTNISNGSSVQNQSSSSKPCTKLFDKNTKICIKKVTHGSMPYLLIGPENVDPNEKLPVLVYLHGLYNVGSNPDDLEKFNYDPANIVRKWNLSNFRGYILCPQISSKSWCNKAAEAKLRNVLSEFESTHNVDKSNISVIGFSLGGAGALYMANEMSDVFKKAVALSPYEPHNLGSRMKIPTKAFAGSNDDNRAGGPIKMTTGKLKGILGSENCEIIQGAHHGAVPPAVFCRDKDKDGCSDIISWLFS